MIEFEDLTPLDDEETVKFYPFNWFMWMARRDDRATGGLVVDTPHMAAGGTWDQLTCGNDCEAIPGKIDSVYTVVCCFMRNGHKGKCHCWTPKHGIISR